MKQLILAVVSVMILNVGFSQDDIGFGVDMEGNIPKGLNKGDKAPTFILKDVDGKEVSSDKLLAEQEIVVIFYRGEWCPYCNKHMSQLQDALERIAEMGASVVAIAPELPKYIDQTIKKSKASFSIISDTSHVIMDAWNVSFRLDDKTFKRYQGFGINLERASGNDDRILPVPATYIIKPDGTISAVHFDVNYKERMPVVDIIKALSELK